MEHLVRAGLLGDVAEYARGETGADGPGIPEGAHDDHGDTQVGHRGRIEHRGAPVVQVEVEDDQVGTLLLDRDCGIADGIAGVDDHHVL